MLVKRAIGNADEGRGVRGMIARGVRLDRGALEWMRQS